MKTILKGLLILIVVVVIVLVAAVVWWVAGAYEPQSDAESAMSGARDEGGWYEFGEGDVGVVVYPGARVDAEAYAETAQELSRESGAMVAVVRVPLDFALADGDAADEVIAAHPEIENWVVAGHSLGGVAAAGYADDNPQDVDGLLLWASYPAGGVDLSGDGMEVASIYGSRDGVLNRESLDEARVRLPDDTEYVEVPGMNHAQFGDYGVQDGDGRATIPDERATREVVAASEAVISSVR